MLTFGIICALVATASAGESLPKRLTSGIFEGDDVEVSAFNL